MKRERVSGAVRRGFTLIELLVVIAIIGILMGLLLAAVMKVSGKAEEVQTQNDIRQLDQAVASFKVKFNVSYFPSRFFIGQKQSDFMSAGKLGQDSFQYINTVWRHIQWKDATGKEIVHSNWPTGYLQGHQCLVFFLGGPPVGQFIGSMVPPQKAPAGFSTNPLDPFAVPVAWEERISFFDFPSNRLTWIKIRSDGSLFPCFLDPYKKSPYAYFSSYKTANGYERYERDNAANAKWPDNSDCITLGVWPYAESITPVVKYLNPSTHQIISAGLDKVFGRGYQLTPADPNNLWSAKNPLNHALWNTDGSNRTAGNDDVSNFHDRFLGIPAN